MVLVNFPKVQQQQISKKVWLLELKDEDTYRKLFQRKNYGFVEKTVAVWTFFWGGGACIDVHVLMIQITIKPNQTVCPFKKYVTS